MNSRTHSSCCWLERIAHCLAKHQGLGIGQAALTEAQTEFWGQSFGGVQALLFLLWVLEKAVSVGRGGEDTERRVRGGC